MIRSWVKVNDDEEEKKAISKTMIQNYIKEGLLMPPYGKFYNPWSRYIAYSNL